MTRSSTQFDPAKPYANTPAANWGNGADGITLPTPVAVGDFSAQQVGAAEAAAKQVLVAGHLDNQVLVDHDPSAFLVAARADHADRRCATTSPPRQPRLRRHADAADARLPAAAGADQGQRQHDAAGGPGRQPGRAHQLRVRVSLRAGRSERDPVRLAGRRRGARASRRGDRGRRAVRGGRPRHLVCGTRAPTSPTSRARRSAKGFLAPAYSDTASAARRRRHREPGRVLRPEPHDEHPGHLRSK